MYLHTIPIWLKGVQQHIYTCMSIIIYITTKPIRVERSDSRTELRLLKGLSITHYFYTVTTYYIIYLDMYKYCNMRIRVLRIGTRKVIRQRQNLNIYILPCVCVNKDIIKHIRRVPIIPIISQTIHNLYIGIKRQCWVLHWL